MGTTEKAGSSFGLDAGDGEFVTPAGGGPPYHLHRDQDESFYVLEGEMTFYVGDAVIQANAGSFAFGARNVPHTFVVGSQAPVNWHSVRPTSQDAGQAQV